MLSKSDQEWDRDESFMINLLDGIIDKLEWILDPSYGWEIKINLT